MIFVSRRVPSICSPIILVFYPKKTNNHDVVDLVAVAAGADSFAIESEELTPD